MALTLAPAIAIYLGPKPRRDGSVAGFTWTLVLTIQLGITALAFSSDDHRTALILGIVVGFGAFLILALTVLDYVRRRIRSGE